MSASYDVIIIGSGVSGLYSLYRLRELGMNAHVFEAGTGVGGTWYWNRYPGARFDSESYSYQYSFSQELLNEWAWSEQFAGQPEIERYLNFVADKFDLKRDITFNARVKHVHYDEAAKLWHVETENGEKADARFVLAATGLLSAFQMPDYQGIADFKGRSLHTARWPKEGIDFKGRRVGIIGSGPTAVQVIQTIAPDCGQLTVFQRTANWCTPLRNYAIDEAAQSERKKQARDVIEHCNKTFAAFVHDMLPQASTDVAKEERWAKYQELYDRGGFALWFGNYNDIFTNLEFANEVSEFLAEKIRQRVKDPVMAEKLIPKSHPYGTKRPPGEKNYYEAFNLPHVDLVDLRATPIERITEKGIKTTEQEYEFDDIIFATGFQSLTGEILRIDIRGEGGLSIQEKWANGPKTHMGVQVAGFPNFFAIMGPQNPATFCNITRCIESNVDWIVNCIGYLRDHGYSTIKSKPDAEAEWTKRCQESVKGLLINDMRESWFFGNNNRDGGSGQYLMYVGSVPAYREMFADVAAKGYPGFELR